MTIAQPLHVPDALGFMAGAIDLADRRLSDDFHCSRYLRGLQVAPDGVVEEPGESWRASGHPMAPGTA